MFECYGFYNWAKRQKIFSRISALFVLADLQKFAEQNGDIIRWDVSNWTHILTHGGSGVACALSTSIT